MTQNQAESLDRLRDELSRVKTELLNKDLDVAKLSDSLKEANREIAEYKNKLIDIQKILNS